jgi:hypothetical protein
MVMAFVIQGSTGGPLPQEAMRSIVEAVDTWRGQAEAFVVFHESSPYEIVSVHPTDAAARTAVAAGQGLTYVGPVAPRPQPRSSCVVLKTTGCGLKALSQPVSTVVLRDASDTEVAHFTVNVGGRLPNHESDVEAIFLTASGIDKFMMPYLTRVFGVDYAAARRRDWIKQ